MLFLIILLYALIALTFILAKISVGAANPLVVVSVRMISAGILLLLAHLIMLKKKLYKNSVKKITRDNIADFIKVALFHVYIAFVPEFWALQYLSSIKTNLLYALTPFITLILSYLINKEKITRSQLFGLIIAFVSTIPMITHGEYCSGLFSCSIPEFVLLLAITSAAYAWFIIKKLLKQGYSLILINGISMLIGGQLSALTWIITRHPGAASIYDQKLFFLSVFSLIIISNFIVYNLYGWLLRYYSINQLAAAGFMCPLFGAIFGYFFLGEILSWYHVIALIGIMFGLHLFFLKDAKIAK